VSGIVLVVDDILSVILNNNRASKGAGVVKGVCVVGLRADLNAGLYK
jgi:hypothetical protein